jgi:hypothetical protein
VQIPIDVEDLKSVLSIDDEAARQIIDQTKEVRINETTPIEWKRENQRITVTVPTNLGDGLLIIDLIDEHGGTTTLAYDQKAKKFRGPRKREGQSAKSPKQAS